MIELLCLEMENWCYVNYLNMYYLSLGFLLNENCIIVIYDIY